MPTPYQKWARNGGYDDFKLDESTYNVVFYGNPKTSSDMVWYYWIYRCAELTRETGYEAFTLTKLQSGAPGSTYPSPPAGAPPTKPFYQIPPDATGAPQGGPSPMSYDDGDDGGRLIPVHAGGTVVMRPIYIPGGTVTVNEWSARGIVTMYHVPLPLSVKAALNAQAILDELRPYVASNGKVSPPGRIDVLKHAAVGQKAASI